MTGPAGVIEVPRDPETIRREAIHSRRDIGTAWLFIGWMVLGLGVYFLVFAPSASSVDGVAYANFHRLTLGQTSATVGAIFIATGHLLRARDEVAPPRPDAVQPQPPG